MFLARGVRLSQIVWFLQTGFVPRRTTQIRLDSFIACVAEWHDASRLRASAGALFWFAFQLNVCIGHESALSAQELSLHAIDDNPKAAARLFVL